MALTLAPRMVVLLDLPASVGHAALQFARRCGARLVQAAFSNYATMKPHIESRKLRLLSVSKAYAALPNLPTFAAQGFPRLDSHTWIGVFAPASTPKSLLARLSRDFNATLTKPEIPSLWSDPRPPFSHHLEIF